MNHTIGTSNENGINVRNDMYSQHISCKGYRSSDVRIVILTYILSQMSLMHLGAGFHHVLCIYTVYISQFYPRFREKTQFDNHVSSTTFSWGEVTSSCVLSFQQNEDSIWQLPAFQHLDKFNKKGRRQSDKGVTG